jgi:hypothetical protein
MAWTIHKRISLYPKFIIAIYLAFTMYTFFSGRGFLDAFGNPLGSDFLLSWSISKMVLTDDAKEVYNQEKIFEIQKKITGVYHRYPAYYPPSSLIFMAPLALLPYIPSFILWMGMTLLFYFLILYRIAPNPATIWLALAFPGAYINFSFGQNAFLVGALIGGGLLLMDRAPLAAGFLLGLSIYKPHIAILIPFVLLTQKKWKVFASMLLTIASLILISLIAFGIEAWAAFWKNLPNAIEIIEKREIRLYNMTSVMAAALRCENRSRNNCWLCASHAFMDLVQECPLFPPRIVSDPRNDLDFTLYSYLRFSITCHANSVVGLGGFQSE